MRIYNKKKFVGGLFCVLLGAALLATALMQNITLGRLALSLVLVLIGTGEAARSMSKKLTKEDKLELLDERNRLIGWKTKSKAFQLTQAISFLLMLALMVMSKVSGYEGFLHIGVGLAFAFSISMFAELFSHLYYEAKN